MIATTRRTRHGRRDDCEEALIRPNGVGDRCDGGRFTPSHLSPAGGQRGPDTPSIGALSVCLPAAGTERDADRAPFTFGPAMPPLADIRHSGRGQPERARHALAMATSLGPCPEPSGESAPHVCLACHPRSDRLKSDWALTHLPGTTWARHEGVWWTT